MRAPFVREWLRDDQILCYRFYEMSRATMDDWFNDVANVAREWPGYKPMLTLIDLRMESLIVGAQVLLRTRDAALLRPQMRGRTAVLIASPAAAGIISGLLRTTLPLGVRQRQVFADETKAIDWLLEPVHPRR